MREDAHDDKAAELHPHRALMQTYLDDSMQPASGQDTCSAPATAATSSIGDTDVNGTGPGMPQVA